MRSSLQKIERIKDILDLNGKVLTYKHSDEEITLNLGEEQLSSIFSRFIKRNLSTIKSELNNGKLVKCQSGLGISCLFIPSDNEEEFYLLTPFLEYLIPTKLFHESLTKYGASISELVCDVYFSLPITPRKKFNYLVELLMGSENVDYLGSIVLIEDTSVKNVRRSAAKKNNYLNSILESEVKFKKEILEAVVDGNISRVNMLFDLRHKIHGVDEESVEQGINVRRRKSYNMNDLLRYALEQHSNDYLGVEELWVKIKNKLDNYDLSEDVIRSYCLLVDREKYKDKQAVVRNCIAYINDRISEKISLDNVSDYLGVNKSYLSSIFNKDMGISIVDYIHDKRVSNACYLLENTDFSISEIADYIGYFDTSYFIRIFKTLMKVTPLKYRESLSKK
ncbi:transcriptional regulator, AraC family [Gemella bergeri ATCC 700627]|uniref:Transcriptional regulator, AraC family n=1 Tax=Gemella bergeri ATCC 700627 TaxID=1321820 RepID=U2Q2V2_9BACL|nr:helix-turn-helix domain-containing protein [Gemella bergeri]ERK57060.1 transcriptional regulator, AraC family [Gemella bergeri ATCC 700627]